MTTPISVAKLQSCKTRWPCIGGAPCQGRAADEIIVIDDESTDDSVRVIDRFAGGPHPSVFCKMRTIQE